MKVKELVQMFSVPAAQEKTAVPKEKLRPENPQGKLLAQRRTTIPARETGVQPKLEDRKEQKYKSVSKHPTAGPPVQPRRKGLILLNRTPEKAEKSSATDGAIFESKKDSKEEEVAQNATDMAPEPTPTAAKRSQKEDLSMIEAAQPDVSTSRKVKELAQMFAVQETAARPQPKRGQERRPSQKLPDPTSTPTTMKTASSKATKHQDHTPSGEASELAGFCAGPKVKDLARMFSAKTY
ncbi:neurofilament heavy polypeptide-like [Fundulus heteroclitus]|uniref:neurofilament heavy polypeptide-like n=1 Tax=Fundulus heteroclitus TaxID=8078 RepID=UPI00165BEB2E|nr:neurofilament heavy polypeptide-like [Fundulus heteroclitus]